MRKQAATSEQWPLRGVLSLEEAQLFLRCSQSTLYRLLNAGAFRVYRSSRRSGNGRCRPFISERSLKHWWKCHG